jgi:lysophospholipase L1-like esterase
MILERVGPTNIDLLIIGFGANDAAQPESGQHVPLARYQDNLRELVNMVKSSKSRFYSPKTRVLLVTPPPLEEEKWNFFCSSKKNGPGYRTSHLTQKYAEACVKVGKSLKVPVLDLHTLILEKAGLAPESSLSGLISSQRKRISEIFNAISSKLYDKDDDDDSAKVTVAPQSALTPFLEDGLHLSALGNQMLFEGVLSTICRNWPELNPDKLEMQLPLKDVLIEAGDESTELLRKAVEKMSVSSETS